MTKAEIESTLLEMRSSLRRAQPDDEPFSLDALEAECPTAIVDGQPVRVWTRALQRALDEHPVVRIPAREAPYLLDGPVLVGSHCRILAHGATIRLMSGVRTLMLRNRHVTDGSHAPEDASVPRDEHITIEGGRWEESRTRRQGYGSSGCFDEAHSMPGVTTCMLFSNVRGLTLRGLTFAHTAGFSVQIGNAEEVDVQEIRFDSCYADGVHLNGRLRRVLVEQISGHVGDDLVALNPYDWDNSGINFGPAECVMIDGVFSDADNPYKAIRLQPGVYRYDDGSEADCAIEDLYLRRVRGIKSYKLYLQTPRYIDMPAHPAGVGRCGALYFEDLDIDLDGQIDAALYELVRRSEGYNVFGAFELCANIHLASFEHIRLTLHREEYPASCLVSVGPKSVALPTGDGRWYEIFDPYACCHVDRLIFRDVLINGRSPVPDDLLRVIRMHSNPDFPHTLPRGGEGYGEVGSVEYL